MRKARITALLLAMCMVFSLLPFTAMAEEADRIIIHVDSKAKFSGDGSEKAPFKTIDTARIYLRSRDHRKKIAEVIIHAGIYPQVSTLTFSQEDSGTEEYPVIYRSAGDGEVRVTNAVRLNHMEFKPISDPSVVERIPTVAQGKVGVLDLESYNLDFAAVDYAARITDSSYGCATVNIYLNDKRQDMARWPNVGFEKIITVVNAGEVGNGDVAKNKGEWKYESLRPERWLLADQAVIRGYIGSEYNMDHAPLDSVNVNKKTILINEKTSYGVKAGYRWFVENLLEEIDSPGEFFIDKNTKKLYYYPPYRLKASDKLTVSTYMKSYIQTEGASNIIFDGINVYDSAQGYGYYIHKSNNITVRNATIQNIGSSAVYLYESTNSTVEGCTVQDIGKYGINIRGGADITTITPSNNRVANCHFYNWATARDFWGNHAINVGRGSYNTTMGDVVENNVIHGAPYGQGIHFGGMMNQIRYNEICGVSHEGADLGVIYAGRTWNEWDNETSYNYIHNYGPIFAAKYQVSGIYWDDWMVGQKAHHNIIVPGTKNRTAGNLFVRMCFSLKDW